VPVDYAKAMNYWELAAQQGNCHSFLDLGSFYDRGIGVALNYSKGADYLARGVKCAPANSYYLWKLGKRIEDAKGVPRDCVTMSKLYFASMVFGYIDAAADLGYLFDKGCDSILRDDKRALQMYLGCAKAGVALCQNNVGAMLKHGRGIGAPDLVAGYAWLKLAAENGNELAQRNLEDYHDMFSDEVRQQALQHLVAIKAMVRGAFEVRPILSGELEY
jgi:TPR repeat protein